MNNSIFPYELLNKQLETLKEPTQEEKEYWDLEYKKCMESPYYFYTTYFDKVDIHWTEEEFNKEFNRLSRIDKPTIKLNYRTLI